MDARSRRALYHSLFAWPQRARGQRFEPRQEIRRADRPADAFAVRLSPPRLAGGMRVSISAHSSSLKSEGYLSRLRSWRARLSFLHIGGRSRQNQAAPLESQIAQPIQYLPELTLGTSAVVSIHPQGPQRAFVL